MAETLNQYVGKMLASSSQTRIMDIDTEYKRIVEYFTEKGISMDSEMRESLEEELMAVFVEDYIHHYEYKNPQICGFSRPLTERESLKMEKERLLNVVSNFKEPRYFDDLMDLLGFEYEPQAYIPKYVDVKEDDNQYLYYETICKHPKTGLVLVCFLGSSATGGSFGFELTQENWDKHMERTKEYASELSRQRGVELELWVEELLEGLSDEEKKDILDVASHIGIIEGRMIDEETLEGHKKNNPKVNETFGGMPFVDAHALITYSLDCLNAKCRENGDPEIY